MQEAVQRYDESENEVKFEYNCMGERVAVQIPLSAIDAFATRGRQQAQVKRWRQQQQQQQEQEQHGVRDAACLISAAAAEDHGVEGVRTEGKRARDHDAPAAADISSSKDTHRSLEGPWTSIGTTRDGKSLEHIAEMFEAGGEESETGGWLLTDSNSANDMLSVRPERTVSKSLGFGFGEYSTVSSRVAEQANRERTEQRPSRAAAAAFGEVPAGFRNVWSRNGCYLFSSWCASGPEVVSDGLGAPEGAEEVNVSAAGEAGIVGEGECVRTVREALDMRSAMQASALAACQRYGMCPPGAHSPVVGDAEGADVTVAGARQTSTPLCADCPVAKLEPLGVALYKDFRRRYGLVCTTEERIAGLLGALLEHRESSAILRLFARIVGAPAGGGIPGGRWPLQTKAEDLGNGLETPLAELVTNARDWLSARGFMTLDGPWLGDESDGGRDKSGTRQRQALVTRTHAAMCTAAVLRSGWGSGHRIMGSVEQAILELPAVRRTAQRRLRRGLHPWSEAVDAEEFLETLLLVVLRARRLVAEAGDALFGAIAVEGHSFLIARARNINAGGIALPAGAEALDARHGEDEVRATEHLHEDPPRSVSSIGSTNKTSGRDGEGGGRAVDLCVEERRPGSQSPSTKGVEGPVGRSAMRPESGTEMEENEVPGEAEPGETGCVDASGGKTVRGGNSPSGAETDDFRPGNALRDVVQGMGDKGKRLRERMDELGGGNLWLLQPLLDGFIREDKHRNGTLPVDVFRRVLADCHGALWPGLGGTGIGGRFRGRHDHQASSGGGGDLVQRDGGRGGGSMIEDTDPRLNQAENDATRALARRYMNGFDGQVCYLDVWITLYHAVFRTGKVIPFLELPSICDKQLRGADPSHWEAVLDYLENKGAVGSTTPLNAGDRRGYHDPWHRDGDAAAGPIGVETRDTCAPTAEAAAAGGADEARPEATLGLLQTTMRSGASTLHGIPKSSAEVIAFPRGRPGSGTSRWLPPGWGPGSLTVSRPPHAAGAPKTAAAVAAALVATEASLPGKGGCLSCSRSTAGGAGVRVGPVVHSPYLMSIARCQAEWVGQDEVISRRSSASERFGDAGSLRSASCSGGDQAEITPTAAAYGRGDEHHVGIPGHGLESEHEGNKALDPQTTTVSTIAQSRRAGGDDRVSDSPVGDLATRPSEGRSRGRGGPDGDPSQEPSAHEAVDALSRGTDPSGSDYPPSDSESGADYQRALDADESSEEMIMFSIDEGILEPPSPPWPPDMVEGGAARKTRRKRERRVLTSIYVRCPFLDPVRSKHAYRVPRGGVSHAPPTSIFLDASDSDSLTAKLVSMAMAEAAVIRSRCRAKPGLTSSTHHGNRPTDSGQEEVGPPLVVRMPRSLKDTVLRQWKVQGTGKHVLKPETTRPGPGGGGGRGGEEAAIAAAEGRRSWTGQRCRMKGIEGDLFEASYRALQPAGNDEDLAMTGTTTGERRSPPASRSIRDASSAFPRKMVDQASSPRPVERSVVPERATVSASPKEESRSRKRRAFVAPAEHGGEGQTRRRASPRRLQATEGSRGVTRLSRRRTRTRNDEHSGEEDGDIEDEEEDEEQDSQGSSRKWKTVVNARKDHQQKMILAMMAEKAAKRRTSGDEMKRLIAEEEERKLAKKKEEEEARRAQEKAREEAEEHRHRDMEKRRKALERRRAEIEEKNRRLEEERQKREQERLALQQARRREAEMRRLEEAARLAEEERLAREEEERLKEQERERLRRLEEERLAAEQEAARQACLKLERRREAKERERMCMNDEDIDIIIQANLDAIRERERLEREEEAARQAEALRQAAEDARRNYACLLMSKEDQASRLANAMWAAEEEVQEQKEEEILAKRERARVRVVTDEQGNPIDVKMWEIECTVGTDANGRLVHRQTYGESDTCVFDPREVFPGEGGGIGGRGGGRGDGSTQVDPVSTWGGDQDKEGNRGNDAGDDDDAQNEALDPKRHFEREKKWMEALFAASRPGDLSLLFSTSGTKLNPNEFFPMVVSKSLAWPDFMEMARAALFKQTDAFRAKQIGNREHGSRPIPLSQFPTTSAGLNESVVSSGKSPAAGGAEITLPTSSGSRGVETMNTRAVGAVMPLVLGEPFRGKIAAGVSRAFKFVLPASGPVVTVVLDSTEGDMTAAVARGCLPGGDKDAEEWNGSETYQGVQVIKIFPHDRNYGAGEYFVGVLAGRTSRFVLRVSISTVEQEISTHMQAAAAIVDNLAIMAEMSPERLVVDFVGARLEAREKVQKRLKQVEDDDSEPRQDALLEGQQSSPATVGQSDAGQCESRGEPGERQPNPDRETRPEDSNSDLESDPGGPFAPLRSSSLAHFSAILCEDEGGVSEICPELSTLRERERSLSSVAALDDRMTRARPFGLLSSLSSARPASSAPPVERSGVRKAVGDDDKKAEGLRRGGAHRRRNSEPSRRFCAAEPSGRMTPVSGDRYGDGADGPRGQKSKRPWTMSEYEDASKDTMCGRSSSGGSPLGPVRYTLSRLTSRDDTAGIRGEDRRANRKGVKYCLVQPPTTLEIDRSERSPGDGAKFAASVPEVRPSQPRVQTRRSERTGNDEEGKLFPGGEPAAFPDGPDDKMKGGSTGSSGGCGTRNPTTGQERGRTARMSPPFPFEDKQGIAPRLISRHSPHWPPAYLTEGDASQPSTKPSTQSGRRKDKRRQGSLEAAREEKERADADAQRAIARAEPNIFPEIVVASGSSERGAVGWQGTPRNRTLY